MGYECDQGEDLEMRLRIDELAPGITIDGSTVTAFVAKKIAPKGGLALPSEPVAFTLAGSYLAPGGGDPSAYLRAIAPRAVTATQAPGLYIVAGTIRLDGLDHSLGHVELRINPGQAQIP